jgi:hypothetical protein
VAGELTDEELRLATVGWKHEKRRSGKSVPVNIIGGYRFPGAADIKLAAIPLEPESVVPNGTTESRPLAPSLPEGDGLDIPAFLTKI